MRKNQIKVGQLYRHEDCDNTVYLGIGEATDWSAKKYLNVNLVIVKGGLLGHIVVKNNKNRKFWNGFHKINS
jgi:hypothetical protein